MEFQVSEQDVLKLIKQRSEVLRQSWIVEACYKQINAMEADIAKLRRLIKLCENPEVIAGIELFVGKDK